MDEKARLRNKAIECCYHLHELANNIDSETFRNSWVLVAAAERKFELLGDCLRKLAAEDPETYERVPNREYVLALAQEISAPVEVSGDRLYACCTAWPRDIAMALDF
jgi:hypothetical protein